MPRLPDNYNPSDCRYTEIRANENHIDDLFYRAKGEKPEDVIESVECENGERLDAAFMILLRGMLERSQRQRDRTASRFRAFFSHLGDGNRLKVLSYWVMEHGSVPIVGGDGTIKAISRRFRLSTRTVRRHLLAITKDKLLGEMLRYYARRSSSG